MRGKTKQKGFRVCKIKPTQKSQKLQFLEWPLEAGSKTESISIHVKNFLQPGTEMLVSIANFPLHDNCTTALNYIKA